MPNLAIWSRRSIACWRNRTGVCPDSGVNPHGATHELVREGRGKCCVAMARAPDHALANQALAKRRLGADLLAECQCHVSPAVRPWPALGHRAQVSLFGGCYRE